jgi:hypothetical protein|tara:strand:+ start:15496 stop:15897 length:402 start_codon:yes stop_codon:yes gene_type:complete
MDFYIRKNSTEPVLKMKVIEDGKNDYGNLHDKLANSSIKFSMRDYNTGVYKILNRSGSIVSLTNVDVNAPTEYYIFYRFREQDTNTPGRYQGEFSIYFNDDCAELIVPIRDNLFININDSFARSNCAGCVDNT